MCQMLAMLIRKQRFCIKSESLVLLAILLCAYEAASLESSKRTEEVFLSRLVAPTTGEINEEAAELLWISCRLDLIFWKETNKGLNFWFPVETSSRTNEFNSQGWLQVKQNIQKLIKLLHPQSKQTLLDCIRKDNLTFHLFREEGGSNVWSAKCLDYLRLRLSFRRRRLHQSIAVMQASAVRPPISGPAVSVDLASSPIFTPPSPAVTPKELFFPPMNESQPQPGENDFAGSFPGPYIEPDTGKDNRNLVVIAVVVTATVTFVVAALLFFSCTKICRRGPGVRRNNERPLVLHTSQHLNSSSMHDKSDSSFDSKLYIRSDAFHASQDGTPSLDTPNKVTSLLPLPPGRISNSSSLKPSPGRANLLPNEPSASPKHPTGIPPPSPPAPPQPPKDSVNTAPSSPGLPSLLTVAPSANVGPRPPPPPKGGIAPPKASPPVPTSSRVPQPTAGSKLPSNSASAKAKLKPFFWDKVLPDPNHSMVWHEIKSGSFQFNEETIESLFGYASTDKNKNEFKKESSSHVPSPQYIQILDPKKAQNLSILLRALKVTMEEVCHALHEGNELPAELLQALLKMAPSADEELKLRLFTGELLQLGTAEHFLKALIHIPFAFKRLEVLLFIVDFQEDVNTIKKSFETLEVACKELRSSRLFLKLLEAVLKTGNRMNDGTFRGGAQAFKLDTLLKLSDVKGTDGKTTLLQFVVQEIICSEGVRAAHAAMESQRFSGVTVKTDDLHGDVLSNTEEHYLSLGLQVVSCLSTELENVKRAAVVDSDSLTGTVSKLGQSLSKTRDFLNKDMKNLEEDSGFHERLKNFVQNAEVDVMWLTEEEERIMALVKKTGDYFHGKAAKDEGFQLFVIVRDFLIMLDKVCKDVREARKRSTKALRKEASTASSPSSGPCQQPSPEFHQRLFQAIVERADG